MADCDGMKCFLFDGCPGRTGVCYACGPDDDGCPVYRWFKEKILKEQPEQKHGHWQNDKYGNMLCSVCGGLAIETIAGRIADWHLAPYLSNYCPQCGARMDEEVKQE